ncbi:MAG: adenine deaminase [Clostridium sp.]|jgi:adenine deaminase
MEVELIVKNIRVYNSYFKKFIIADVAIMEDKFLYIGKEYEDKLSAKEVVDGQGKYMIPGLIDIHMHIESSMTIPSEFSKAVIPHGVTTVVADPHEIANVFGVEGIKAFISEEEKIDIFYGIPSSVPSTSKKFETTGGFISDKEVSELLAYPKVICLGEVMNFKDLIQEEDSNIKRIINLVKKERHNLPIEGHCPKIEGLDLAMYIYRGVDGDHTQQSLKSIEEKISNGMFLEIQEKSMSEENMNYLRDNKLYEHFCLVTDDVMADKLTSGHLNKLVKKAMDMGISEENAIYVATYTPARRMGLLDRGVIAPGKIADFVLLKDVKEFKIHSVYKNGKALYNKDASEGNSSSQINTKERFPGKFYNSIKLNLLNKDDFKVETPILNGELICRTMKVAPNTTFTEEGEVIINSVNGQLQWKKKGCALIAVFERYGKTKGKAFGIVDGSIIKEGAVATTWAHDHHNLMVMGRNVEDMIVAANEVINCKGGYAVANKGHILGLAPLPIGGIVSDVPIEVLGAQLKKIRKAMKQLGYDHNNEIMSFSTLSLPVSPALKITDKGLIDVKKQEIVSLFKESSGR